LAILDPHLLLLARDLSRQVVHKLCHVIVLLPVATNK
jgi:hypothetical protein